jgi:NADPH:quinone reductase-like Zn-dependent oxidoreductase
VVQLAARRGATVIATARPGDERRLRELGAAETVDYTSGDVAATVRERHPEGIDGLVDVVNRSPEEMAPLVALVRAGGGVASAIGAAAADGRDVTATNVVAQALDPAVLREVVALAEAGELRVPVEAVYPLDEAAAAVAAFSAGKRGKLVLTIT